MIGAGPNRMMRGGMNRAGKTMSDNDKKRDDALRTVIDHLAGATHAARANGSPDLVPVAERATNLANDIARENPSIAEHAASAFARRGE